MLNGGEIPMADADSPKVDFAAPFTEMAAKIARNPASDFAGAFVIVAPDGSVASLLTLDPAASPVIMWANIQTKAELMLNEAKAAEDAEKNTGFQHRR